MATQVKHRRGNTSELSSFTPAIGELVMNTDTNELVLGDGVTVGGVIVSFGEVNDISTMKSRSYRAGYVLRTKGYLNAGDGGDAHYLVKTSAQALLDGDVIDGYGNHELSNGNVAVLLTVSGSFTLKQFGVGFGNNDADALVAAFSKEKPIRGEGLVCIVEKEVLIQDKDIVFLDSPNTTFKFTDAASRFNFKYSYSDVQNVSNVDNTALIDMSDGTAVTDTPCSKITVTDGSAYQTGDVVKIVSDDTIFGTNPSDNEKIGEHAIVFSVQGNDLYLDRRLRANDGAYNTTPRVAKASEKQCSFGSFCIDGDYDNINNSNRNLSYIRVEGCANLSTFGKIRSKNTQSNVFNPASCYKPSLDEFVPKDGRTKSSVGAFAHCILFTSGCNDFEVKSVTGRNMRHLVDTTAFSASASDEVWRYGGTIGGYVDSIVGIGMQAAPASTHNDSDQITFGSVVSLKPIHGPNGYQGAVGLRGRDHSVQYVEVDDGTAVYCFNDHFSVNTSRDHTIGKIVVNNRGQHNRTRAISVQGQSSASVTGVNVGEVVYKNMKNNNISPVIRCEYGSVRVEKVTVVGGCQDDTIDLIDCNQGGVVDIDRFIGRDLQNFSLIDMDDDTCVVKIDSVDIETDQVFGYLANLNNTNSYLRLREVRINNRGSSSDLINNRGASADIIADWQLTNSDETSDRNRRRLPSITASSTISYDIDISDNGAPILHQKFNGTVTGASVGDISDGNYFGQQLVIYNNFSNTGDLSIPDNANGLRVNATITLQPSEAITAMWTGFEWVVS